MSRLGRKVPPPSRIERWIAKLILWTPIGDIPGICDLHYWWLKRRYR